MKVVLLSSNGQSLTRDVYKEIARRMNERGCDDECVSRFISAADEFQGELDDYAQKVP